MKSERIAIVVLLVLLVGALGGFGVYLKSETNRGLSFPQPLDERIAELETTLSEHAAALETARTSITDKESRIEELVQETAQLTEARNAGQAEMASLRNELEVAGQSLATARQETAETQTRLEESLVQLQAQEDRVASLNGNMEKALLVTRKLKALVDQQRARIAELEAPPPEAAPTELPDEALPAP